MAPAPWRQRWPREWSGALPKVVRKNTDPDRSLDLVTVDPSAPGSGHDVSLPLRLWDERRGVDRIAATSSIEPSVLIGLCCVMCGVCGVCGVCVRFVRLHPLHVNFFLRFCSSSFSIAGSSSSSSSYA